MSATRSLNLLPTPATPRAAAPSAVLRRSSPALLTGLLFFTLSFPLQAQSPPDLPSPQPLTAAQKTDLSLLRDSQTPLSSRLDTLPSGLTVLEQLHSATPVHTPGRSLILRSVLSSNGRFLLHLGLPLNLSADPDLPPHIPLFLERFFLASCLSPNPAAHAAADGIQLFRNALPIGSVDFPRISPPDPRQHFTLRIRSDRNGLLGCLLQAPKDTFLLLFQPSPQRLLGLDQEEQLLQLLLLLEYPHHAASSLPHSPLQDLHPLLQLADLQSQLPTPRDLLPSDCPEARFPRPRMAGFLVDSSAQLLPGLSNAKYYDVRSAILDDPAFPRQSLTNRLIAPQCFPPLTLRLHLSGLRDRSLTIPYDRLHQILSRNSHCYVALESHIPENPVSIPDAAYIATVICLQPAMQSMHLLQLSLNASLIRSSSPDTLNADLYVSIRQDNVASLFAPPGDSPLIKEPLNIHVDPHR